MQGPASASHLRTAPPALASRPFSLSLIVALQLITFGARTFEMSLSMYRYTYIYTQHHHVMLCYVMLVMMMGYDDDGLCYVML